MPILVECSVYQSSIFLKCNPHALACSKDSDIAAFCTAVHMLSSVAGIYMELGQDSDIAAFCTAVHMLSSVAGIYMELGQD
jgi:hypothetical protein